jgi:hypothetical protein
MKINFTKKEYRVLVEMLLTADWVIRAHEVKPRAETKPYDDMRKKVLSHFKAMGMEDSFEYDAKKDEYYETREYEEGAPHMRFIDEYEEQAFWEQLATKLAHRDLAAEGVVSAAGALDDKPRALRLFEIIDRYEQVFAESGIRALRIEAKPEGVD